MKKKKTMETTTWDSSALIMKGGIRNLEWGKTPALHYMYIVLFEIRWKLFAKQINTWSLISWLQVAGAAEAAIRNLPPSAIGDPSNFNAMGLLASNKGSPMQGIVEQVRDGSTIRVYLLPEFQFVQVFVAGIQVCILFSD